MPLFVDKMDGNTDLHSLVDLDLTIYETLAVNYSITISHDNQFRGLDLPFIGFLQDLSQNYLIVKRFDLEQNIVSALIN